MTLGSFENTYRGLYESARAQSQRLSVLQNLILAEFPEYYKQLPESLEHYLQLRSLFAFVEELWARLTNKYRSVYKAPEIPSEQIPDAVRELESLLKEIQAMPLESFVHRKENGLLQVEELVKQFSERLDFIVLDPCLWFSDLMGMLRSYGISYSGILDPTLSDSFPKGVTIGEKMDLLNYLRIVLRKEAAKLAERKFIP
jgi:hypothetical protein